MSGIGIERQKSHVQVLGEDQRIDRRNHDVRHSVDDKGWLLDRLQLLVVSAARRAPSFDCLQLGIAYLQSSRRVRFCCAGSQSLHEGHAGLLAGLAGRKKEVDQVFWTGHVDKGVSSDFIGIVFHSFATLGTRSSQDQAPHHRRVIECELLGDESSGRKTEHIDGVESQRYNKSATWSAISEMLLSGAPVDPPTPALSKRITSWCSAMVFTTAGSQLSKFPRKCCKNRSGASLCAPNRR